MQEPEQNVVTNRPRPEPVIRRQTEPAPGPTVFGVRNVSIWYSSFQAVTDVSMEIYEHEITAFIGSSGSGKTTVLRSFNRMNDLVPGARLEGEIFYRGQSLYAPEVSPIAVRRRALWDEVKNRLGTSGLSLSGGQAQRLCIARTIAVEPDVVLMDEPASALDPIATGAIEDLMQELKTKYTIVIVTHNMQQATRVSGRAAFFSVLINDESDTRTGVLVEFGPTGQIFQSPRDPRTQAYVTGRIG